ncbi:family 43 glycosylhydrolase [Candidatus Bathyarchaeota archaeon]|nr:family 43 glycosylhydrolase [Candidatus Bathyarchaeota archaeon]
MVSGSKKIESAATKRARLMDLKDDRENEFFTTFRYYPAIGLGYEEGVARRDPTDIIKVDDTYYVWYTRTSRGPPPVGRNYATDVLRATTWDRAEIWYATSKDGYVWKEQGKAIGPGPKGSFDSRTVCTPGILVAKGRYYLFYQAYSDVPEDGYNVIGMACADSPDGPWEKWPEPILVPGEKDDFDGACVHDPMLIVRDGKYWLYYKGHRKLPESKYPWPYSNAKWGVAIAKNPEGPYIKSEYNPVTNSGHEVVVWPYKEGVCALITDGPEKNTIQYAPDGLNFEIKAHLGGYARPADPPQAAGPYRPDAFTNTKWGQGITWGLSQITRIYRNGVRMWCWPHLIRFECNLSINKKMNEYP